MKRKRIIDRLRAMFPGRWTWNEALSRWEHEAGWHVTRCAKLAPRFDGDDEGFVAVYIRSDTEHEVPIDPGVLWKLL